MNQNKIAIITDTHFGARNDDQTFAKYFDKFYNDIFFPYLKKNSINRIIHCGDIVDRRKYINYLSASQLRKTFLQRCFDEKIHTSIIIGNHDSFYKNTNEVNSMNELCQAYKEYIEWFDEPTHITVNGNRIALIPWITTENYDKTLKFINNSDAKVCLGHLELKGFGMYKGIINEHGTDPSIFSRFNFVGSGHYHHKSSKGNMHYFGAPYQITMSDFDDSRGFHVFDCHTHDLTYIKNPYTIFEKFFYDDEKTDYIKKPLELSQFVDKYVKIIEVNKTNPYLFDKIVEKIEQCGAIDVQVVLDHKNQDKIEIDEEIEEMTDTLSIINNYVDNSKMNNNRVKTLINEIYMKAMDN